MNPVKVIVKTKTLSRKANEVYRFFENMESLEVGGQITGVQESSDGWWTFDHAIAGKSKMKQVNSNEKYGMLNHIFVGEGLTWNVYI